MELLSLLHKMGSDLVARSCALPVVTLRDFIALVAGGLLVLAYTFGAGSSAPGSLFSDAAGKGAVPHFSHLAFAGPPSPPPGWKYTASYKGAIVDPRLANSRWTSQCGQDKTVRDIFGGKREGYFLELASNDAFEISNTVTLEQEFGWQGLCMEANEKYAYDYRGRSCLLVQAVVGTQDDKEVVFDMFPKDGFLGGIVGFDRNPGETGGERVKRRTVSLVSILKAFGAPSVIDYFSLDIEGAEYSAMKEFDFSAYIFLTLSIERPGQELRDLLAANGYVYLCTHGQHGDDFFFHESMLPDSEPVLRNAVLSGIIGKGDAPAGAPTPCTNSK